MHCARCHITFRDPEERCRVPHIFVREPLYLSEGCSTYSSECCGQVAVVTECGEGSDAYDTENLDSCFEGKHTTWPDAVKYNGINILRCKTTYDGSCTRTILVQSPGIAVFRESVARIDSDWLDRRARGAWFPASNE